MQNNVSEVKIGVCNGVFNGLLKVKDVFEHFKNRAVLYDPDITYALDQVSFTHDLIKGFSDTFKVLEKEIPTHRYMHIIGINALHVLEIRNNIRDVEIIFWSANEMMQTILDTYKDACNIMYNNLTVMYLGKLDLLYASEDISNTLIIESYDNFDAFIRCSVCLVASEGINFDETKILGRFMQEYTTYILSCIRVADPLMVQLNYVLEKIKIIDVWMQSNITVSQYHPYADYLNVLPIFVDNIKAECIRQKKIPTNKNAILLN